MVEPLATLRLEHPAADAVLVHGVARAPMPQNKELWGLSSLGCFVVIEQQVRRKLGGGASVQRMGATS